MLDGSIANGNVIIGYYDHLNKEIKTIVLQENFQIDDHDNPALLFVPDGRLMVFFTKHGGPDPTFLVHYEKSRGYHRLE